MLLLFGLCLKEIQSAYYSTTTITAFIYNITLAHSQQLLIKGMDRILIYRNVIRRSYLE